MDGFQKRASQPGRKKVGLAVIRTEGLWILCSCGWAYSAQREKVRGDAAERHLAKKHNGQGVWL